MDPALRRLIEAIHQSAGKSVLALAGGGTGAVAQLLAIPGGSRTILEVIVPYHEQALVQFLGHRPPQFCSAVTCREMAVRAYERAAWLAPGENVLGLGCTASLATDRPKRGEHRFHLTCHGADHSTTYSLTLAKDQRQSSRTQRQAEEAVLDAALLNALAEAYGAPERVPVPLLADETLQSEAWPATDLVSSLLRGELPAFYVGVDGQMLRDGPGTPSLTPRVSVPPPPTSVSEEASSDRNAALPQRPMALLPGAFNPVHQGHWKLAEVAYRILGIPVAFELSVANVDKPALSAAEIRRRLQQFTWRMPVWVTNAPTFVAKAALFPGVVFVVGADTAQRIFARRYYGDSETRMAEALQFIRRQGCRFLVAGRRIESKSVTPAHPTGKYVGLDDLGLTEAYRDLFSAIPKEDFDVPISSTFVREQAKA